MSRQQGLKPKYIVERLDGTPVVGCIVLEFNDPNSWPAMGAWAETVESDGYIRLAEDIRATIRHRRAEHTILQEQSDD